MKCRSCLSVLESDGDEYAKRCATCQAWQGNRRWLELSNVLLATTISFSSIALLFFNFITSKAPEIKFSLLSTTPNELRVLIANTGNAPAAIAEVYLSQDDHFTPIGREQWGEHLEQGASKVIELNRPVKEDAFPVIAQQEHKVFNQYPKSECTLTVRYVGVGEIESKSIVKGYECYVLCFPNEGLEHERYE
ncbi:TPA: hypothetical protein ACVOZE_004586 [Vibrio diabolicus]